MSLGSSLEEILEMLHIFDLGRDAGRCAKVRRTVGF